MSRTLTDSQQTLGIDALGGALAPKRAMEEQAVAGGIRFPGEPAENIRGSQPIHVRWPEYETRARGEDWWTSSV